MSAERILKKMAGESLWEVRRNMFEYKNWFKFYVWASSEKEAHRLAEDHLKKKRGMAYWQQVKDQMLIRQLRIIND